MDPAPARCVIRINGQLGATVLSAFPAMPPRRHGAHRADRAPGAVRGVTDYTSGQDAALGLISPIFADLSGLPPLIIQAGTHEVLLDDAVRLAQQAATADVEVTLDITPGCPTSSKPFTRSSTKRPRRWTEPDSSCRRISPVQNASPESERQNANCPHNPEVAGSRQQAAHRGPGAVRCRHRHQRSAQRGLEQDDALAALYDLLG
jgi:acetyl esterase/lipase